MEHLRLYKMADYGIKVGWYIYANNENNNGKLTKVYKTTNFFVSVRVYNYYDSDFDLNHMDDKNDLLHEFQQKVDEEKTIYPYTTKWLLSFKLSDDRMIE